MEENKSEIEVVKIEEEMQGAYLEYAMSVIAGRALPDVRDGLKPVHRRILFAMHSLGLTHEKKYMKSARVVGDVIGKYHPHGDGAVYNALVRMAQDFSLRYPLVDGQGNFGSVDGDNAAAMRYTECKMEKITSQILSDLEKETVDYVPNYDGTLQEPSVFPTRVPNLLINGSSGIAVGMSTNIPPHNIGEVLKASIAVIDNPAIDLDELMKIVPGPDLPTGGIISRVGGIRNAYRYGKGSFVMKGKATIEPCGKDREAIIVTELPFQLNKANWIESIASRVRDKEIEGISDLRDESDRKGMRVVIELKKGEQSQVVLNNLYAKTQLKTSFGITLLAIDQGRPKLFSLKECLQAFVAHRKDVVTRRSVYELKKAKAREHILLGLQIALDNIDAVVELIKKSASAKEAKVGLAEKFGLSDIQAQAVLDMRLQKLTSLETQKLLEELKEIKKTIARLELILGSDEELFRVIKSEIQEQIEKFEDPRRSEISTEDDKSFDVEDFVRAEEVVVTVSNKGYVKRNTVESYKSQGRGGKGIRGAGVGKDDDFVDNIFIANTHSYLLCFSNLGKLHWLKVHRIPEMSRTARGRPIVQLLQMAKDEQVMNILPVKEFVSGHSVLLATKMGLIKKVDLMAFSNIRSNGIIAIGINDGDELMGAALISEGDDVFLATHQGRSIRFSEKDVREMGRSARGVKGIQLSDGDYVVGMSTIRPDDEKDGYSLLSVTEKGYGKRTKIGEYRQQGRGGSGIINIKVSDKNGPLVSVRKVCSQDDVIIISDVGQLIRTNVEAISEIGRSTQGVRVIRIDNEESVKAFAVVREEVEEDDKTVH